MERSTAGCSYFHARLYTHDGHHLYPIRAVLMRHVQAMLEARSDRTEEWSFNYGVKNWCMAPVICMAI
jgi:hypothetical protein